MVANPISESFVFGDRLTRPIKPLRTIEHIIRDIFTAQGFIGLGITFQCICTFLIPHRYAMIPGAIFIATASWPTVSGFLGLKKQTEETTPIVGKTSAYLHYNDPSHVGKRSGDRVLSTTETHDNRPPKLAIMLIGSQCHSRLGAIQPEFKAMGEVFATIIHELRTAPPEEDIGFLNAEFYMHSGQPANNSNMACLYFKSYDHMLKFAHMSEGSHWNAWSKFRKLQRDQAKLGTEIGLWHEVYEVSNAEAIYINMPRFGLGDLWDAVPAPNGNFVYRNSLISANATFATSDGRMGYHSDKQAPVVEAKTDA